MFFHRLSLFDNELQKGTLMALQDYCKGTPIDLSVLSLLKGLEKLLSKSQFTHFPKAMDLYMVFSRSIWPFPGASDAF